MDEQPIEVTEEVPTEPTPDETTENAEQTTEQTAEQTPETTEQEPNRTQQRISELVAQREEARRKAADLEARLAKTEDADAPKEDAFESYEDYTRALIKHEAQAVLKTERQADIEAQREAEAELSVQQFNVRAEQGRQKHEDFDSVVGNPDLAINVDMLALMAESDVGADVAYHLGKNPAEARRLSMMPPAMMGREMARIEAKLSQVYAPSIPQPVETGTNLSGAGESSVPDLSKMSTEEYIAARRARANA